MPIITKSNLKNDDFEKINKMLSDHHAKNIRDGVKDPYYDMIRSWSKIMEEAFKEKHLDKS